MYSPTVKSPQDASYSHIPQVQVSQASGSLSKTPELTPAASFSAAVSVYVDFFFGIPHIKTAFQSNACLAGGYH